MKKKIIAGSFLLIAAIVVVFNVSNQNSMDKALSAGTNELFSPTSNMYESSKVYVDSFKNSYPNAFLTKIRWQYVPDTESYTYIIDGIEGNNKYSIKYSAHKAGQEENAGLAELGIVERELNEFELSEGKPVEKPLKPEEYLSHSELEKISNEQFGVQMQEWKVVWIDGKEYIRILAWGEDFKRVYVILDPRTGQILRIG